MSGEITVLRWRGARRGGLEGGCQAALSVSTVVVVLRRGVVERLISS
jgi:hypothetical protein